MNGLALCSWTLATLCLAGSTDHGTDHQTFEERAERWFARNQIARASIEDADQLLENAFVALDVGALELLLPPAALSDPDQLEDLQQLATSLVDAQLAWIDWFPEAAEEGRRPEQLAKHGKELARWIRSWKAKDLSPRVEVRDAAADTGGGAADQRRPRLLELTEAREKTREASRILSDYLRSGGPLRASGDRQQDPARLVLIPDRENFVELMAVVGLLESKHRPYFWIPGTETWTNFDFDGVRVLALSYATPDAEKDYRASIPMNAKNADSMAQQIVQLGTRSVLELSFGEHLEPMLAGGIANDLVIELFGEVDTRSDGDLTSREAAARSLFVPGGNPDGGILPANDANSRWRSRRGADWFVDVLRSSQKDASKRVGERWQRKAGFLLKDDGSSETHVALAPFLGAGASQVPPTRFRGDHAEFLRAYRACFLHWLREHGAGKEKASRAAYAQLLRGIAENRTPFQELFPAVYGAELSLAAGADASGLCEKDGPLEGRFLNWLAKQ